MKTQRRPGPVNSPDPNGAAGRSDRTRTPRRGRTAARRPHETRAPGQGPQTAPAARPAGRPAPAKNAGQAKARAKARKAKAPKVVRLSLRERLRAGLIAKLDGLDLRPQALLARVPFVVLVIGSLAFGPGITLWLSTDAARRSYQLGNARALNDALTQQKEALERDVLQAESAPALAESARELGMIPSRGTAHLVQDLSGNWIVVGQPKPAEGVPPPPLNTKLPEEKPPPPAAPAEPKPGASPEVPVRILPGDPSAELPVRLPPGARSVPGVTGPPGVDPVTGVVPGVLPGLPPGPSPLPAVAQLPEALSTPPLAPFPGPADVAVPGAAGAAAPPAPIGVPVPEPVPGPPVASVEPLPAADGIPVPVPAPPAGPFPPPIPPPGWVPPPGAPQ